MKKSEPKAKAKNSVAQITPDDIIKGFIDKNDAEGVNDTPKKVVNDYKISTGSLKFDQKIDGGLGAGVIRLIGPTETGKTSEALTIAKNFQLELKKSLVIYFKVEGRLSDRLIKRSNINTSPDRFTILNGRRCSFVFGLMKKLIEETNGINYCFIIDSVDALTVGVDDGKDVEASKKIGSVPMVLSNLLPQICDVTHIYGHMAMFLSQHRDNIVIGHQKKTKNIEASGGNALLHYPDWSFEYDIVRNGDVIWDEDAKVKTAIGHTSRLVVKKSMNETTLEEVHYPIRRKAAAGKSVWIEREVYDFLFMFDLIKKKGAWFKFDENIIESVKEYDKAVADKVLNGIDLTDYDKSLIVGAVSESLDKNEISDYETLLKNKGDKLKDAISVINDNCIGYMPEQIQGEAKTMKFLDSNPILIKFFIDLFKKQGILHKDQKINL